MYMQLGKLLRFLQSWITSFLRLVGSNPSSGKEIRLEHPPMLISLRWHSLCRPSGKVLSFSQCQILSCSRDASLCSVFAIDSNIGQIRIEMCFRAAGNWSLDDKDVSFKHP